MKYRSRTEIVSMILEAANGGATKTKIMYKAFLSYAQLREYLSVLIENALLEYLEGNQKYKTTEKGLNLLKMHNEIRKIVTTNYYNQKWLINLGLFGIIKRYTYNFYSSFIFVSIQIKFLTIKAKLWYYLFIKPHNIWTVFVMLYDN